MRTLTDLLHEIARLKTELAAERAISEERYDRLCDAYKALAAK